MRPNMVCSIYSHNHIMVVKNSTYCMKKAKLPILLVKFVMKIFSCTSCFTCSLQNCKIE